MHQTLLAELRPTACSLRPPLAISLHTPPRRLYPIVIQSSKSLFAFIRPRLASGKYCPPTTLVVIYFQKADWFQQVQSLAVLSRRYGEMHCLWQ